MKFQTEEEYQEIRRAAKLAQDRDSELDLHRQLWRAIAVFVALSAVLALLASHGCGIGYDGGY